MPHHGAVDSTGSASDALPDVNWAQVAEVTDSRGEALSMQCHCRLAIAGCERLE